MKSNKPCRENNEKNNEKNYIGAPWHRELQQLAARLSLRQIAGRLECSPALVSQVVNGRYAPHRVENFREKFEGAFMGYCVNCPVAGELARDLCLKFQRREFCASNPTRVQLYHACRSGCEHSRIPLQEQV